MDVTQTLQEAIAVGAPAYNKGRPDVCAKKYVSTAEDIVQGGSASKKVQETLRSALIAAHTHDGDANAQAWTLRRAFDQILDGQVDPPVNLPVITLKAEGSEWSVLDLSTDAPAENRPRWIVMDDVIMGGRSSSSCAHAEGALFFQGNVTTDGGGGFASIRTEPWSGWSEGLGHANALRLLVKGDDRVYKISAKTDDRFDGVQYQHDFFAPAGPTLSQPENDGWQVVDLPFESFFANIRGKVIRGQPPLTGASIRQLGLMVSKFGSDGNTTADFPLPPQAHAAGVSAYRNGTFRLAVRVFKGLVV